MVTAALLLAHAAPAHAETWRATRGTVAAGRVAGSYVISSDAAPGRYSEGGMVTTEAIALPYTLSARWRRLGPEGGRSMHVFVIGGVVLIRDGAITLYAYDDTKFADGNWRELPGYRAHVEHAIAVTQDDRTVTVVIDGGEAARFELVAPRTDGHLGFGMKSGPGSRTTIYVRDIITAH